MFPNPSFDYAWKAEGLSGFSILLPPHTDLEAAMARARTGVLSITYTIGVGGGGPERVGKLNLWFMFTSHHGQNTSAAAAKARTS
jgi:hypothetical protein